MFMTFQEYKQGLKQALEHTKDYDLSIKKYNEDVSKYCDFKVRLGDLVSNIEKSDNMRNAEVQTILQLNPYIINSTELKDFRGLIIIQTQYRVSQVFMPVIEKLAKFGLFPNTQLTDGSMLKDNVQLSSKKGVVELELCPEIDVNDLIVDIDLTNDYMLYPAFVKALFKCNIIEPNQPLVNL